MIYLDNAATTMLDSDILDRMLPYFSEHYGNASSVHTLGRDARMAVERARQQAATALGGQAKDIIFTSSASEANNLAIKGTLEGIRKRFKDFDREFLPEIIASPIEHPCVLESLKHVEQLGWCKVQWLPVNIEGVVSSSDIESRINENTVMVSVMYVNNEIGSVQPVNEIGQLVRKTRWSRLNDSTERHAVPIYFHSDSVQAIQYFETDVNAIGVDLLSLTAHKLYGPKGAGLLYVREGVPVTRQIDGGGQEYYKRAGTENVAAIVGLGESISRIANHKDEKDRLAVLQNKLIDSVLKIDKTYLTGPRNLRAPHITSFLFEGVDGESLITALDREGLAVSSGSACSSGVVRQSHVIEALPLTGFDVRKAAALRISCGRHSIDDGIDKFIKVLPSIINKLRELDL